MTSYSIDATSLRRIDISSTSLRRHMPAGILLRIHLLPTRGWSDGAKVLGKQLPLPGGGGAGVQLIWIIVG